jgi:hypothetical protein
MSSRPEAVFGTDEDAEDDSGDPRVGDADEPSSPLFLRKLMVGDARSPRTRSGCFKIPSALVAGMWRGQLEWFVKSSIAFIALL